MKVQKRPPKKPTRIGQRFNNAKLDKSKIKISSTIWAGFLGGFKHFQLYLATCCNHCYVYLVKNGLTWFERFFWLILIAMANYATIYVAWKSIDRYLTKNAFIGIDRDYLKWNTTLPSVTICPMERLDRQLFNAYCQTHQVTDKRRETLWDFLEHLANSTYMNFEDIPADPSIDDILNQVQLTPNKYMEVIFNLTRNNRTNSRTDLRIQCDHMGTFCHTRQILTEYGLCYLANSLLDEKYSSQYALFGTLPEANPYERKNETVAAFHITYIDKHMDYYFIGFNTSIDLYVHSPYEIMKVDNNYGYSDQNAYFDPEVVEITTEDNFER
uniref:Uncharacterized protein n=1 Tax=Stomoxys calcitrans TaxID=35570 RepID=A0A1I8PSK4_STOCA